MNSFDEFQKFNSMPPPLDYGEHPAFIQYSGIRKEWDDKKIHSSIAEIDAEYLTLLKGEFHNVDGLTESIQARLYPKINSLGKYLLEKIDSENYQWIDESIKEVKNVLKDNLVREYRGRFYQSSKDTEKYIDELREMQQNGFAIFKFSENLLMDLANGCATQLAELRAQLKVDPESRAAVSIPLKGLFGRALSQIVKMYGVERVASEYKRCDMELLYASLEVSVPTQTWYKNCYEDVGLKTSQTVTMHYDYDTPVLKAMIYLNKVDLKNGATGIIPGSHLWERSPFTFAFVNELDHQYPNVFPVKRHNENYYRPRFKYADDRRRFARMPVAIQGTSHFGDDLIDGSLLSSYLLKNEVRFVPGGAECMLFDGAQAIHRGGIVFEGERVALQIAFHPKRHQTLARRVCLKFKNTIKFMFN